MSKLDKEQVDGLVAAIRSHEFLHRILRQIEVLQRTVFHDYPRADWTLTRASAEQMLVAELSLRYRGDIDRVYFRLREMEKAGKDWAAAINDFAAGVHSYFTTPLGMVMRRDLFGDEAAFLSRQDASQWITQAPTSSLGEGAAKPASAAVASEHADARTKNDAARQKTPPRQTTNRKASTRTGKQPARAATKTPAKSGKPAQRKKK